jgi:hypothetical protein
MLLLLVILVAFGLFFAVFAVLGPAERPSGCDDARFGDPKCEHCPLDAEAGSLTGPLPAGRTGSEPERPPLGR